ncbi:MAG: hypothetical protein JWP12_1534 [Bacteroidetes bacterium]|nr:hypothetical protein [Bacteroidota bacterium]
MRKKIGIPVLVICALITQLSIAQQAATWATVGRDDMAKTFEKMGTALKNTPVYSMVVTHTSFENYKTIVPFERSVGYFKKNNNSYHSFLLGIHTVQNPKYRISVDSSAKIVMVANNDNNSIFNTYGIEDYKEVLNSCTTIKVISVGTDKLYRMEFKPGSQLTAQELVITEDGFLKKLTWFYSKEVQKDPEDKNSVKAKPRLEITFSELKKNPSFSKKEFDEKEYFSKKETKLLLTEKYKAYQLSDQRITLN